MSLFDTIMAESEKNVPDNSQPVDGGQPIPDGTPTASWWWDKATPGQGDRPEWLPDKYKSVEDVAKAYKELEKKFGTAPEQYDWSKGQSWIDPEYEPFQEMAAFAKSKHVPQEVFDSMLDSMGKYLDEFNINYEEEKAELGENAVERLTVLNNWAKSNFSEDTYHALTDNMKTASAVKAIEEMRTKMIENKTTIPTGNETTHPTYSLEDVQQELKDNLQKYKDDPNYRKQIQAKFGQVANQSKYVDKNY